MGNCHIRKRFNAAWLGPFRLGLTFTQSVLKYFSFNLWLHENYLSARMPRPWQCEMYNDYRESPKLIKKNRKSDFASAALTNKAPRLACEHICLGVE